MIPLLKMDYLQFEWFHLDSMHSFLHDLLGMMFSVVVRQVVRDLHWIMASPHLLQVWFHEISQRLLGVFVRNTSEQCLQTGIESFILHLNLAAFCLWFFGDAISQNLPDIYADVFPCSFCFLNFTQESSGRKLPLWSDRKGLELAERSRLCVADHNWAHRVRSSSWKHMVACRDRVKSHCVKHTAMYDIICALSSAGTDGKVFKCMPARGLLQNTMTMTPRQLGDMSSGIECAERWMVNITWVNRKPKRWQICTYFL